MIESKSLDNGLVLEFFNGIEFYKQPIETLQPPMKIFFVRYMLTFILIFQSNENYSFVTSVI